MKALKALRELVELKDLKEDIEARHLAGFLCDDDRRAYRELQSEYERRKPLAWVAAREVLCQPERAGEAKAVAEPVAHQWDRDGERCLQCGAKDWMDDPVCRPRPCTCHPDDNPPVPCARKYALSECKAATLPPEQLTAAEIRNAALEEAAHLCWERKVIREKHLGKGGEYWDGYTSMGDELEAAIRSLKEKKGPGK